MPSKSKVKGNTFERELVNDAKRYELVLSVAGVQMVAQWGYTKK